MAEITISIQRGTYHIRIGKNQAYTLQQKEIGEIVGYQEDRLLCLKDGKYHIRTLQGKSLDTFTKFVNPYPMRIPVTIGEWWGYLTAKDEDEESRCRRTLQTIRKLPGQSTEEKLQGMLELLAEADARNSFATLYYSCDKAWPRFLDKVSQSYPFREDKEAVLQNFASDLLGELISIG